MSENQIVVYQPNETIRLDVRLENETVWLTQDQMVKLFGRDQSVIARHISNIFKEGELDRKVVYAKFAYTTRHGAIPGKTQATEVGLYNLDVVISVGYRVKSVEGTRFRQWATQVLKEFMLRGYAYNQRLNAIEDRFDRRIAKTEQDVVELKEKVDFFVQTKEPPLQGVFYDGQLWDARVLVLKLVSSAKRSLILIDNWATTATLDLFAKKRKGVKVSIITSEHYRKKVPHHQISDADIETFNGQYPKLAVFYNEKFHDRFLIIDDKELYLIGASLKDLGWKCFAFTKLDSAEIPRIKKSAFASANNHDDSEISCSTGMKGSSLFGDISGLADSLMALYKQSYDVLLPLVDDMCRRKETVTQDELDHCFDSVSEIACTDFGKSLFDKLCATFKSKYPESVDFYVKEHEKLTSSE